MSLRIQLLAIGVGLGIGIFILELIRKKKLLERYALLWLAFTVVLLIISIWKDLLEKIASLMGIYYAASALFLIAFFCGLLLMLHVTVVISGLTEQNTILAQKIAMLEKKVDELSNDKVMDS